MHSKVSSSRLRLLLLHPQPYRSLPLLWYPLPNLQVLSSTRTPSLPRSRRRRQRRRLGQQQRGPRTHFLNLLSRRLLPSRSSRHPSHRHPRLRRSSSPPLHPDSSLASPPPSHQPSSQSSHPCQMEPSSTNLSTRPSPRPNPSIALPLLPQLLPPVLPPVLPPLDPTDESHSKASLPTLPPRNPSVQPSSSLLPLPPRPTQDLSQRQQSKNPSDHSRWRSSSEPLSLQQPQDLARLHR